MSKVITNREAALSRYTKKELISLLVNETQSAIKGPADVSEYVSMCLDLIKPERKSQEHFFVLCVNAKNKVIHAEVTSIGTATSSLISVSATFRTAISKEAVAIIIAHNHPSGNTEPSEADDKITKRLVSSGKLLGIEVLDHLIISRGYKYYSYSDMGRL